MIIILQEAEKEKSDDAQAIEKDNTVTTVATEGTSCYVEKCY